MPHYEKNNIAMSQGSIEAPAKGIEPIKVHELAAFFLFLNTGLGALYFVKQSGTLSTAIDLGDMFFDLVLVAYAITKVRDFKGVIPLAVIVVVGMLVAANSGSAILLKGALLIFCLKDEDYVVYLKCGQYGFLCTIVVGLVGAALGLGSSEEFRRGGLAFGFGHPNQAALYASLILLMRMTQRYLEGRRFRLDVLTAALAAYLLATGSRTALAVVVAAELLAWAIARSNGMATRVMRKATPWIPLALMAFAVITALFIFDVPFFQALNNFFTGRVWLNNFALSNFDITLLGQKVDLHVEGVHNPFTDNWNVTTTIDCTYISCLIAYGVFGIGIWLVAYFFVIKRAWSIASPGLVSAAIILAFYAFTESQLMGPLICFPFMCLFSSMEVATRVAIEERRGS